MTRAVSVTELLNTKFNYMPFDGEWLESFGEPEMSGTWIIWGSSGNGKTTFILRLAKYLTNFDRVIYNSLEEGVSGTMQTAFKRENMKDVKGKFLLVEETMDLLADRLRKHKSPKIVIVDSFQYTMMTKKQLIAFNEEFKKSHLIIYLSHADGKNPEGRTAKFLRYHCNIKIFIEGYMAMPTSRYGGNQPYIIWEEGANEFHGLNK